MAFKLIEPAQQRWRAANGPDLFARVRAGAIFEKGVLSERPNHAIRKPRNHQKKPIHRP
jgi:hypothetical protein